MAKAFNAKRRRAGGTDLALLKTALQHKMV
jgi:hypothetical protein